MFKVKVVIQSTINTITKKKKIAMSKKNHTNKIMLNGSDKKKTLFRDVFRSPRIAVLRGFIKKINLLQ